jgi:Outer membrane protein beta-barrel domain
MNNMPENEFEKQVQHKMDGLKLNPSVKVWQNVAAEIKNEKGGRKIFAIILLALLFISAGIFIQFNYRQQTKNKKYFQAKDNSVQLNNTPANNDDNKAEKITEATSIINKAGKDSLDTSTLIIKSRQIKEDISRQKSISGSGSENAESRFKKNKTVIRSIINNSNAGYDITNKPAYTRKQKLTAVITNGAAADGSDETESASTGAERLFFETIALTDQPSAKTILTNPIIKNGNYLKNKFTDIIQEKNYNTTALHPKQKTDRQSNKWKIGFNVSAGISTTQNGYLGVIGSSNSDAEKAYIARDNSTGNNAGQGSSITYYPSKIKSGAGLAAGIFVQKNISPKIIFSIGLNYKTYNSAMIVGNRVDSAVIGGTYFSILSSDNYFYRTGTNTSYKNHFHFIELPLAVNFKLNNKNKRLVYLTGGISISRLFSSNALQFDTTTGKYYSNNNLFNKTQLNISAGMLFSLSRHPKNPLLAGPDVNFSLNKIASTGLYGDRHYSYFGIRIQKTIGKR